MNLAIGAIRGSDPDGPGDRSILRFAVLSDTHLAPAGTPDGVWNNVTRRSAAMQLLQIALTEIVGFGHTTVLVLGDISDDGSPDVIRAALSAIAGAGITAWVVPGNHDAALRPDAIDVAAESVRACSVLHRGAAQPARRIALVGVGLQSSDGGQTCTSVHLPDVHGRSEDLLIWSGHYPILSQEARLAAVGLRYPGDLLNLTHTRDAALAFAGPILALHGHLHTAVTGRAGRILQLGCPAMVEWPHAWTDLTVEVDPIGTRVRATTRPIAGDWSRCEHNTQLAEPEQAWQFEHGHWLAAHGEPHGVLE